VIYELLVNGAIESGTHYAILKNETSWGELGISVGLDENRALSYLRMMFSDCKCAILRYSTIHLKGENILADIELPETLPVAVMPQLKKCHISCYPQVDSKF